MNKIGNIVTTGKPSQYSELFNVVKSMDEIQRDLPTLIIGWKNVKSIFPDANILIKEYNGINWTFSKTERRCDYEDDVINFYNKSILSKMSEIKYIYVDIIRFGYRKIVKIIDFLKGKSKKLVFYTKNSNFVFIYSSEYKTIFGISLTLVEYLGITKRKVTSIIKNAEYIKDTGYINSDIRKVIGNNTHYILPLFEYFH